MGNINALRDWGHAKDYVEMQWLMLQQDTPDDFVIATGFQHSVREFIIWSAKELGIDIEFQGKGLQEIGVVAGVNSSEDIKVSIGDVIVKIDERYFRPTEVETLLGNPAKAKSKLNWVPKISVKSMCSEMVAADLLEAKKQVLLSSKGFNINSQVS